MDIVQRLGFDAKFTEFKSQIIVSVSGCDIKFPFRSDPPLTENPSLIPGLSPRVHSALNPRPRGF
jgi:hypothetical protein